MTCPMCFKRNTPKGRIACVDCGYMALSMNPIRVTRQPNSEKLQRLVQLMIEGASPYQAAKLVGVKLSTATNAFLRYVIVPEWAEFKADQEQYALLDAPSHQAA